MPDIRPVLFVLGILLSALAATMLLPLVLDATRGDGDWQAFAYAAIVTGTVGGGLLFGFRQPAWQGFTAREGFLLTTVAWVALSAFAALPFMLSAKRLDFVGAFFESMSGLTTTGASVLSGLDSMPHGLLLWRALLHLIGGIGIIVLAVAVLPMLRVGGMQLFRTESSDKSEKMRPRISQISSILIVVYMSLTALCALLLYVAGMSLFDAVTHAMSAVSTGGFSTHDASVGFFQSPSIEWILTLFMLFGGMTFPLLARAAQGEPGALWRDTQTRCYVGYILAFIGAIALWQIAAGERPVMEALRSSAFNVVSLATTTGFASEDYLRWGSFPIAAIMFIYFIGGCTGSTSGGIKVFRFCILGGAALWQIRHLVHPHRVQPPSYNGQGISEEVVRSVLCFFVFYMMAFALLTIAVAAFGIDIVSAMSAVAQALGNVGPGLTDPIGPVGNYGAMPDGAKWLLSLAMLLGRLELLTVLVLLSPTYWRG
jgi:trk system potassium uptake protein TrkH